jgi:TonB family protein
MKRVACAVLLVASGCGGSARHPAPPPAHVAPPATDPGDGAGDDDDGDGDGDIQIQSTRGHMDPQVVQAGLSPHAGELSACYTSRLGRRRWLGGSVELRWQIAKDGTISSVQVSRSDLGAWPVEKCLLDVARAMTFGPPKGGPADFSIPLEFTARGGVIAWDADDAQRAVDKHVADLEACGKDAPAPSDATITAYVGTRGKVQSVGFASAAKAGFVDDAWAECAAGRVMAWQLPDPRGHIAKLSFHYPGP